MATTAYTATVRLTYTDGSATAVGGTVTQTADAIIDRIIPLTAGQVDQEVDIDFVYTRLKEFFAISTQDATIETNATDHASGDIITLKAGVPFWWSSTSGVANPFAFSVTKMYLTNSSSTAVAQVNINCLYDSTV